MPKCTSEINSGQYSPFQICNEAGTAIDYAWDAENNVWVKATDVMSNPDAATNEQLLAVNTWADVDKMASKAELFLTPFPADVYFPDKPFNNYDDLTYLNQDSNATANYRDPLGLRNVDSSKWPIRFVDEILLKKGEGRTADTVFMFVQVYNPADKSYSLMKYGEAGVIIKNKFQDEVSGYYWLPYYYIVGSFGGDQSVLNHLVSNGDLSKIKGLVDLWFSSGKVPQELLNMDLLQKWEPK
jgi:hypothetical protein